VDKLALGYFFLQVLLFCPVTSHQCSILPSFVHHHHCVTCIINRNVKC
jgi:hypothetical protein